MLPASLLTKRIGGAAVMAGAGAVGAIALCATSVVSGLGPLLAAQFVAGGAWGCVPMSAFAAALALGRTGREGAFTGGLFAVLAIAALARIAMVLAEIGKVPEYKVALAWAPAAAWLVTGGLLMVATIRGQRTASTPDREGLRGGVRQAPSVEQWRRSRERAGESIDRFPYPA